MFELKTYLRQKQDDVNRALAALLPADNKPRIVQAMRYPLMAGGKRIRPILCMAAAEAVGGNPDDVVEAACAIELVHTYSLIHDDLPGMDNDNLRRGKPTLHIAFDEATAILAGDALLTMAFKVVGDTLSSAGISAKACLNVVTELARAAGHQGMIEGQMRDLDAEGQNLNLDDLKALHRLKTGALIEAALKIGAILAAGTRQQIEALSDYGRNIGLAFQITDDILNVTGDPDVIGKATGTDADRQKSTYPALLGLEKSTFLARKSIQQALQALTDFDNKAEPLRALAEYIINRKY